MMQPIAVVITRYNMTGGALNNKSAFQEISSHLYGEDFKRWMIRNRVVINTEFISRIDMDLLALHRNPQHLFMRP